MRTFYQIKNTFGLFLIVVLLFQAQIFAQDRGVGNVKVRNDDGTQSEVKLYNASYALVIGASDYNNGWQVLPGAKDDVPAVRNTLEKHGFVVEELLNPTSLNLLPTMRRFVNKYGLKSGNRLLIYFAGHGFTETTEFGRQFGYIVPIDAPNPSKNLNLFQQRAITMAEIETVARRIRSRHALFIFDSCFSGTLLNARRSTVPEFINQKVTKPVRQFISSGTAEQEVPDKSIFRRQFIEALNGEADRNGDKYVTGTELSEFLKEKVTNYTRGSQTPQSGKIFDQFLDKGDFVFIVPTASSNTNRTPSRRARAAALANRALDEMMRANLDKSRKLANEALRLDSNNALGYGIRGWLKNWEDSDYKAARTDLERAIQLDPNSILLQARVILEYQNLGEHDYAKKSAERVMRNLPPINTAIQYYARGILNGVLEKHDDSIKDYTKAISINSQFIIVYNNRAIAFNLKQKYDQAIQDYTKAIKLNPTYILAYRGRAGMFSNKKKYDRAIRDYTKAIEINPNDANAYNDRGIAYTKKKEYDRAIRDYNKAIEINPNDAIAYNNRGIAYKNKKEYDRAIRDYNKAIEINPNDAIAYNNLGNAYYNKKEYDRAIRDFTKAIEINPNYASAFYNRGNAYYEKSDYRQAIRDSSKAIEINPKYTRAYYDRAYAYKKVGEEAKAEADLKKYRELGGTRK